VEEASLDKVRQKERWAQEEPPEWAWLGRVVPLQVPVFQERAEAATATAYKAQQQVLALVCLELPQQRQAA
jgi:hypothetical protein